MSDISVRFKEPVVVDDGFGLGAIVILVVLVSMIASAIYFVVIHQQKIDNSSTGLLGEICRAQGLNTSASRLLNEVATAAGLPHPVMMLLGNANFHAAVKSAESNITLDRRKKNRLGVLQLRLFGESSLES